MNIVLRPSRIRHNGDTGANVQQGPVPRILFRLRPCINLFYCLLLIHTLRFSVIIKEGTDVLACGHVRNFAPTWTLGVLTKGVVPPALIKTEYLRECPA